MNIHQRTKAAIRHSSLTQEQIAEGVRQLPGGERFIQQNLSSLANGRTLTSSYLVHIAEVCGVHPVWLAMGTGEMLRENTETQETNTDAIYMACEIAEEWQDRQTIKPGKAKTLRFACALYDLLRDANTRQTIKALPIATIIKLMNLK